MKHFPIIYNDPVIEHVLEQYADQLGDDFQKYRSHVYRVFHYTLFLIRKSSHLTNAIREQVALAAAFHDIGIWTHQTLDYIKPSIDEMKKYIGDSPHYKLIAGMIFWHHKTSPYFGKYQLIIESFRRADWIDVTKRMKTFGVPSEFTEELTAVFPYHNFHYTLMKLSFRHILKHPFAPFAMFKN